MLHATPTCPKCHSPQIVEPDDLPWCERCEWNLDAANDDPYRGHLGRRFDRWTRKFGYRLNNRLFREINCRGAKRPTITFSTFILGFVSTVIAGLLAGLVVKAVLFIVEGNVLLKLVGLILLTLAIAIRPRLGSLKWWRDNHDELTRQQAPHLFALLDRCADGIGAPRPDRVFLGAQWNASANRVGVLRHKVLFLGFPLWIVMQPQERVSLLGHEFGHFVNRDVRRGVLTQLACTFFWTLADALRPDQVSVSRDGAFPAFAMWLLKPLQLALSHLCLCVHLVAIMLAARQSQRAEYYADQLAVQLGGTLATASLMDLLCRSETYTAVAGSRARQRADPSAMRQAIDEQRARATTLLTRLRLLSLREESSPFVSHPPPGLRHRMVALGAYQDPKVVLTETESERIDAELAPFYERYRRIIAQDW